MEGQSQALQEKEVIPSEVIMEKSGSEVTGAAKNVLETLLSLIGIEASVTTLPGLLTEGEGEAATGIMLDVEGDDLGILIGRRGQTLACLQYIIRIIVGNQTKVWLPIVIDVEGYKRRRCNALRALAWRMAEQVKNRKAPFTLEPMPAFDRRIIHLALAEDPDVTTQSSGEGEARRVVILPREQAD